MRNEISFILKNKVGFTLVELIVTLAIMSVIGAAIFKVYSFSNNSYTIQNAAADAQQSLRAAMEVIAQDIRMAGLDPTASNNFGIELATATKLRFTSDSVDAGIGDFNGVVDDTNSERITYELQANRLNQILYEGTESQNTLPLIDNVQNLSFRLRIQLYTAPGQVKYNATRRVVLRGVDGIVFVADAMAVRREENILSLQNLKENLAHYNMGIEKIPLVLQYNKMDLLRHRIPLLSVEKLEKDLNRALKVPSFEASALAGTNVVSTLKKITLLTMASIKKI